jgi:hypothetical protein
VTSQDKRIALRERITKAQQRISENPASGYAREAADHAVGFAKRNPLVVVGGAVTLGLALGSLSQRGKRAAATTGLMGRIATDAAIAFAVAMYERASTRRDEDDGEETERPQVSD